MSGHIYRINFLQWNAKGSRKGKKDKKAKFQAFFALFVFFPLFVSTCHSLRTPILKMRTDIGMAYEM
jgi:hypothetical protein